MRRGRRSKREEISAINATQEFYASASDKSALHLLRPLPRERRPAVRDPSKRYERDILREILKALKQHSRVAHVQRSQSGVFRDGDRWMRVGRRGEPDIRGILKGGRAFAIEVKRPGEYPTDIQELRLNEVRDAGGVAGCAHSVDEAFTIIQEGKP